jgi:hypothetical protein
VFPRTGASPSAADASARSAHTVSCVTGRLEAVAPSEPSLTTACAPRRSSTVRKVGQDVHLRALPGASPSR